MKYKGKLITFEGIDGSGKSTQIHRLVDYLYSKQAKYSVWREPGGDKFGNKVRDILLSGVCHNLQAEVLLFAATRANLMYEYIIPDLQNGVHALMDRYYHSTYAYQGYGKGVPQDVLSYITAYATNDVQPDLTLFIDVLPEIARDRIKLREKDAYEQQPIEFFHAVRRGYLSMQSDTFIVLNGDQPIEDLHDDIKALVDKVIEQ